jgi:hypothetical protein
MTNITLGMMTREVVRRLVYNRGIIFTRPYVNGRGFWLELPANLDDIFNADPARLLPQTPPDETYTANYDVVEVEGLRFDKEYWFTPHIFGRRKPAK